MDYGAVGQAVRRFSKRLEREPGLRQQVTKLSLQLSNVQM